LIFLQAFEEFAKQYPNVTWDIKQDQSRTSSTPRRACFGDNPSDLIRLPTLVTFTIRDCKNFDDYAAAFGWDDGLCRSLIRIASQTALAVLVRCMRWVSTTA
jgi:hypothetical protein